MLKITIEENHIDELEKRLIALSKSKAFVGYDQSQGKHEPSGLTYPNLVAIHSAGVPSLNIPSRPVFDIAYRSYNLNTSGIKKDLSKYLSNISGKAPVNTDYVNKGWVKSFSTEVVNTFGDPSKLESNSDYTVSLKGGNTPLVETGDLLKNLSYSIDGEPVTLVRSLL